MIVTIDGPSGAGKSSAARELARRLGFEFLDTGAMYRAVTLAGLRAGIDLRDQDALANLLADLPLELPPGRVLLNHEDVTGLIRTAEVTAASTAVADSPVVRRRLVELQQAIALGRNMVCEGRDQGTLVFPRAPCKFFLVADPAERARRRCREIAARGEQADLQEILRAQEDAIAGMPPATWRRWFPPRMPSSWIAPIWISSRSWTACNRKCADA